MAFECFAINPPTNNDKGVIRTTTNAILKFIAIIIPKVPKIVIIPVNN